MAHIDDMRTQKANLGYIRDAMDEPMLERGHELDLARKWRDKGDQKALHELIKSYMRVVIAMASRFRKNKQPNSKQKQEGNIGLMQAAERFDPGREVRFS